jgi:beta-1,4-mannosyltransferase
VSEVRLRVLQSFPAPRPTTNPYLVQLRTGLTEVADVDCFTFARAVLGRYDVFHVHWPEVLLRGTSPARTLARRALVLAALAAMRVRRTAVVRTVHNVRPHEDADPVERLLLRLVDRRTRGWVHLNAWTPAPGHGVVALIPHGHYRDWYAGHDVSGSEAGLLLMIGLLRPYKGLDALLAAFAGTTPGTLLRVVGRPTTDALRALVADAERSDPRVSSRLEHVDDATVAQEVGRAALVVLPYSEDGNSGAALLALSLGRPVLVPAGPVTDALAAEVGERWVQRYHGGLTSEHLADALVSVAELPAALPDLSARDWPVLVRAHLDLYRAARGRTGPTEEER